MASADSTQLKLPRGGSLAAAGQRARELARQVPLALAIMLGIAVVLRLAMWLAWEPAVTSDIDAYPYLYMAMGEMFSDPARPAGYSIFLKAVHAVWAELDLLIVAQHLLGIATALLLYATVRRVGAPRWVALAAAAAVLLSLDQILLEHSMLAESLFTSLFAVVLYASVRALDDPRVLRSHVTTRHLWIVVAGLALGFAGWTRGIGAPLILFLALWLVFALPGRWWERVGRAALFAAPATIVLLAYFTLNSMSSGYFGLTQTTGWGLYGRSASFADCTKFEPPAGTEGLCEDTPSSSRPGPDFYNWEPESPAHKLFGPPPTADEEVGAFARQAILNQPFDYAWTVFNDAAEHFAPGFHDTRRFAGPGRDWFDISRRDPEVEQRVNAQVAAYYEGESVEVGVLSARMGDLQQVLRVHPVLMLQAVILAGFGIWFATGRVRAAIVLLAGAGLLLILLSVALIGYNARYAFPAGGPLVAAGALGLWVILQRMLERHRDAHPPSSPAKT